MKIKFFLIGSCYSGYMFKDKLLGTIANGSIQLVYQHQHDSLISVMSKPYHISLKGARSSFQWDFDHFAEAIFEKNVLDKLRCYQPDYLIFDTYAEAMCPLIQVNEDTYITDNYYINNSSVRKEFREYPILKPDMDERWGLFKKYSVRFFQQLKEILPDIRIILVRSRGAEEIYENGKVRRFISADLIAKSNILREKYDKYVLENIPDIRELCMSECYNLASKAIKDHYNYSISSNHFSVEYYREEYVKLQNIIISDLLGGRQQTKYFNQAVGILAEEDFPLLLLQAKIYKDFFRVYIHIAPETVGKAKAFTAKQIQILKKIPNVTVLVKYEIPKGSYNQLRAIWEMSDMAFKCKDVKYIHITSNYDMPIRPINSIYDFYETSADNCSFLNNHANGDREQMKEMADDTYGYYYFFYNEDEADPSIKERTKESILLQKKLGISRKSIGEFTDLYKGVIWGSLTREAYMYCMKYTEKHPEYLNDIKLTRLRTEFFFHTLLFNAHLFKDKIKSGIRGGKHGWLWDSMKKDYENVNLESYEKLKKDENNLFVRKVTSDNKELVEKILKDIRSPYRLE